MKITINLNKNLFVLPNIDYSKSLVTKGDISIN